MIKKIALAAAVAATASFATWDKFPVLENHKGQAKVGVAYDMQGDWSDLDLYVGARYTVIPNLELGLVLPYRVMADWDGNDAADGLRNLPLMVRYQFMPIMNAFVDVTLPIGEEEIDGDNLSVHFGVQYSTGINEMISLGSELGFEMHTQGDDKYSAPYQLNVGAEADFAVTAMVTPYAALDMKMLLGESTYDGDKVPGSDQSGTLGFFLTVGAGFAINQMIGLDVSVNMGFGEDYLKYTCSGNTDTPIGIDFNAKFNF